MDYQKDSIITVKSKWDRQLELEHHKAEVEYRNAVLHILRAIFILNLASFIVLGLIFVVS